MSRLLFRLLAPIFIAVFVASPALPQSTGTVTGKTIDPGGLVVPGATVTATSDVLMGARTAVSDGLGHYRLTNLPPGTYVLTVELVGFATLRRETEMSRPLLNLVG